MKPGEIITEPGEIELNAGRETRTVVVANHGDQTSSVAPIRKAPPWIHATTGTGSDDAGTTTRDEPGTAAALIVSVVPTFRSANPAATANTATARVMRFICLAWSCARSSAA